MTISFRGITDGTYFVTGSNFDKQCLLQSERMAGLFIDVLKHDQVQGRYKLHEFVVMPNHFHLLLTPGHPVTLEKAVQFIKGGYSYRAKKELGFMGEIWQTSFYDHRVRDADDYRRIRHYIHMNPVREGLVSACEEFSYSSVNMQLDESTSVAKASCVDGLNAGLKPCSTVPQRHQGLRSLD